MTFAVPPFPEGAALPWDAPLIQLAPGEKLLEVWATPFFPTQQDAPLDVIAVNESAARELAYWGTASWHADMAASGGNLVTLWWD